MLADANFELATALGVAKESGRFSECSLASAADPSFVVTHSC